MDYDTTKLKSKELRLHDCSLRLETIHHMRWKLNSSLFDEENRKLHQEANALLDEMEHKVWDYINGKVETY